MNNKQLDQYLKGSLPPVKKWVEELELYAKNNHVPIMDSVSMHFLQQIIRIQQPKKILEIGTAIGYSALRMLEAYPETSIVTIERDPERFQFALEAITKQEKKQHIQIIHGDALDVAEKVSENAPFDFIFIDAAKGQYKRFFELYQPLLQKGGIIVSDNVLFKGYVASPSEDNPRLTKIANKINTYNQWLINNEDYHTSIVPIGDGIAISIKK